MTTRSQRVTQHILEGIANGTYIPGDEMPAEAELATTYKVSRLTAREAVKALANRGVLTVRHGKKALIAAPEHWSTLDPQLARIRGSLLGDDQAWALQLMEARHILEVGSAALAATRISAEQLATLNECINTMKTADAQDDIDASVEADMAFHSTILKAADNEYLSASYTPLEEILRSVRFETSSTTQVRKDAIHWHTRILEGLRTGNAEEARAAMHGHMQQTINALQSKDTKE